MGRSVVHISLDAATTTEGLVPPGVDVATSTDGLADLVGAATGTDDLVVLVDVSTAYDPPSPSSPEPSPSLSGDRNLLTPDVVSTSTVPSETVTLQPEDVLEETSLIGPSLFDPDGELFASRPSGFRLPEQFTKNM